MQVYIIFLSESSAGVSHGDDLHYLFTTTNDVYYKPAEFPSFKDSDPELIWVKRLTSIWSHFAKTGEPLPRDPELFGSVTWKNFTKENRNYLNFGNDVTLGTDFMFNEMTFWDNLFP